MRHLIAAFVMVIGAAFPVLGDVQAQQPLAIPTPPGATVVTELNVSKEQLLAQMDFISSFATGDSWASILDAEKLKDALGTLERVQFAEMKLGANYSTRDVLDFFGKQVSGRRIFYNIDGNPGGGMILLATGNNQGYLGVIVRSEKKADDKPAQGKITAVRLFGFPDISKIIAIIADPKVIMSILTKGK
ncbi:MAG: hypothetical protein HYX78_01585 [Armatimonadetes bacterium]|nr:hypothetical protein [Armatimonadota bacterium]